MNARIFRYVVSLVSISLIVAGCDDRAERVSSPTAPDRGQSVMAIAAPAEIAPEFLPSPFCRTLRRFLLRLDLTIHPVPDRVLGMARFDFADRFGGRAIPVVTPAFDMAATLPNSMPVPLPSSSPVPLPSSSSIPIPGTLSLEGLRFPSGSRTLPLVLEFGCGVRSAGTLFISVETTDRRGMSDVWRVSARIGS
jgi:hypothetical protein